MSQELISAKIYGKPIQDLPKDLYIPPEALEVFLEAFEGPLDLLLYLIRKQNMDICDIPIAEITAQYVEYVELMHELHLDLAAEYLVMAAMLAEIKSRFLLPRLSESEQDEDDPRAELVRRLQEYEQFKHAAMQLDQLPRLSRDHFQASASADNVELVKPLPDVTLSELIQALQGVLKRAAMFDKHQIEREALSVRERMSSLLDKLQGAHFIEFTCLFTVEEGRQGVVVSFLAMMELIKIAMIEIVQVKPFAPIHIRLSAKSD